MKVVAVIQARMLSTRLRGKVLLPLPQPDGPSVLEHIIQQVKKSTQVNAIVIAIPESEDDDPLFEHTKTLKGIAGVTRGSEYNVLQRFIDATDKFPAEYIVRLTGDNPLIDAVVIDEAISITKKNPLVDYVYTTGLPLGLNAEVIKVSALKKCARLSNLNETDTEHVTFGIRSRPNIFNVAFLPLNHLWSDSLTARFTLDTAEDYTFLNAVIYSLELNNYPFDILHLKKLLHDAPWLAAINHNVEQKQPEISIKSN